jgi:iron complex outermembrane receptor protein
MNISKKTARALAALAGLSVLPFAPGAMTFAQEDDEDVVLEEIVTTGSRIRRDDFSSSSPLSVIGGQAILEQGVSNLGEALRDQAAIGTGGFNQSSILSGGGASSIDLRNLGQSRVLVLINGRRVASFADALQNQAADLSFVPTAMVDRVEILRDGASAVYGSDAITGVVNVILKKDFEGVEASLNTGATAEGDGESYGFSMTMGAANDRGSFVAGAEWRRQDAVKQVDRDWAFPAISSLNSGGAVNGSFFSTGGVFLGNGGAVFCTQPLVFGGNEIDDVSNGDGSGCPSFAARQNVSSPDQVELVRYDYGLAQDLIVPNEVISTSLYGNYQITDSVNAFLEFQYANRQGTTHLDGNPGSFGTPAFPDGSFVPATNPNNPTGEDGFFYFRPSTTIGPRTQDYDSSTTRIVAGLEGDLPFGNDWFWEASALYTSVSADLVTNYTWNLARFIRLSDPAQCAVDPFCAATVNPSGALDTFRPGNWTDAEIEYMRQGAQAISKFDLFGGMAFVSGPVIDLPAGPLNVAFGIESRRETGFAKPDSITERGESVANQTFTTQGAVEVDEVFAEFDIPILNGVTAFEDLTLNLQWRYSDYDIFGAEDVYRAGLNWQITDWIRVRGNVSTAYRAPQVTDLFGGGTASFDFFNDPCDASQSGITPGDGVYENCVQDGLDPSTFIQPSSQYQVVSGGNINLGPETADTATYGIVFTPGGWGEGLQLAIDAWDITVDNLISRPTSDSILNDCYRGLPNKGSPECAQFDGRNPANGTPLNFRNGLVNLDSVETNGYDITAAYAFDAGPTSWNLSLTGVYVDENTFSPGAGGADGRGSIPDQQANFRADMFLNNWSFSWLTRYIGKMDDPDFDAATNSFGYGGPDAYYKHDIRVAYDWERYRLLIGINNVTDEDPPYVFDSGTNTDSFLYDNFGTYWYARLTFSM